MKYLLPETDTILHMMSGAVTVTNIAGQSTHGISIRYL